VIIFIGDSSLKKKVMINLLIKKINNTNYAKTLVFFVIVFFNGFPLNDGLVVMEILQGIVENQYACSSKYPSC
jgi:hypothetical protein